MGLAGSLAAAALCHTGVLCSVTDVLWDRTSLICNINKNELGIC